MNLYNHIKCDKCDSLFDISPFANMLGNRESAYLRLEIYGDKYDLCPKCTKEIHNLINCKNKVKEVKLCKQITVGII